MIKTCFISCSERADDNRISRIRDTLKKDGYQIWTVMVEPFFNEFTCDDYFDYLPCLKNNFYPQSTYLTLFKAIVQRARNFSLALKHCMLIKPEICHCHEPDSWIIGLIMKLVYKSKIIVDMHEPFESRAIAFPKLIQPLVRRSIRGGMKLLSKKLDYIFHVNETIADLYIDFDCPQMVIGNYPELKLFNRISNSTINRDNCKNRKTILIYAGPIRRNIYAYNHQIFLEALEICIKSNPELIFYLVGGVDDYYNEIIARMNNNRLIVIPRLPYEEVISLIKIADIGLSIEIPIDPLYNCATPRKIYDYLAAGKAVITSNLPESSSIVETWNCGVVNNVNTPEGIATTILEFVNDERLQLLNENSKKASIEKYNWEFESNKLIQAYNLVTSNCKTK
jgi:glycosyltransferase involved in cell wall biosynthesis